MSDTEYCVLARESGCKIYGTVATKHKYYISECNVKDKELYGHPTIKPLELVKNHLINSTQQGDVVLDCFMGSGTTGVACKELGLDFIGFELNKKYYDIAVDRINGISQKERRIEATGQMSLFDIIGGQ